MPCRSRTATATSQPPGGPRDVTLGNPGGAGREISSLEDLHKWAVTLGTGALLPKSLQKERLETSPLVSTPKVTIAYGLGITNLNGFLGHDGGILGYATAMFYLPKAKATIVVESNSDNVSAQEHAVDVHRSRLVPVPGAVPEGTLIDPLEAGAATRGPTSKVSDEGAK